MDVVAEVAFKEFDRTQAEIGTHKVDETLWIENLVEKQAVKTPGTYG